MGGWMGVASQKCVPWYQRDTAWQFTRFGPPKLLRDTKGPIRKGSSSDIHFSRNLPNFTGVKLVTLEEFNNQQFPEGHWETLAIVYLPKPWHPPPPTERQIVRFVLFGQDPPDQVLLLNSWNETGCPTKFEKKKTIPSFFHDITSHHATQPVEKKDKNISEPPKFGSPLLAIFFFKRQKKHPKTQHRRFFGKKCFRGASSWHRAVVFPRGGTHHLPNWRSGCGCARLRRQGPQRLDGQSGKSGCFCK